jgi:hypothetical protein
MKHLVVAFAGVALLSACSGGHERRAPETNKVAQHTDLTLPDTVSLRDTSATTIASGNDQPVSAVEQHVPTPARRERPKSSAARRRVRPAAPAPKKQEDTTVQAYAPNLTRDTSSPASRDSSAPRDTAISRDTAMARDTALPGDTATPVATRDTVRSADSTRAADSTSLAAADTSRTASDTASAEAVSPPADTAPPSSAPEAPAPVGSPRTADLASRTLPAGTEIHAALDDSITSRRDTVGQLVAGHVMENVIGRDGRTLIAAGTPVRFTITRIRASRSKGSQGRLALRAEALSLGGQPHPVQAEIRNVPRELKGRGVTSSEAAKVGGGAAAGAVIGGVVGKTKGAVIGGVAGAAAGAVVASQTATRDVVVKAKTPVVLVLTAPLVAP